MGCRSLWLRKTKYAKYEPSYWYPSASLAAPSRASRARFHALRSSFTSITIHSCLVPLSRHIHYLSPANYGGGGRSNTGTRTPHPIGAHPRSTSLLHSRARDYVRSLRTPVADRFCYFIGGGTYFPSMYIPLQSIDCERHVVPDRALSVLRWFLR